MDSVLSRSLSPTALTPIPIPPAVRYLAKFISHVLKLIGTIVFFMVVLKL